MADIPIYENPNGRRRRAARSKNELKQNLRDVKQFSTNSVETPWANKGPKLNVTSGIGVGRVPIYPDKQYLPYDIEEINSFIKQTAKVVQHDYGLGDIDLRINYGRFVNDEEFAKRYAAQIQKHTGNPIDLVREKNLTGGAYVPKDGHIDVNPDVMYRAEMIKRKKLGLTGDIPLEEFQDTIKEVLGHELRHKWQFEANTPDSKKIMKEHQVYMDGIDVEEVKQDAKKLYNAYYNKPIEVDARNKGAEFVSKYNEKVSNYKKYLEESANINGATRQKIDEINLRPKNRIIGHEPDTVAPIEWNVDTGSTVPTGKHDISRNTRYRNAKLGKGQGPLRPTATMSGNNVEIDSIYNHSKPKKLTPKKQYADWFEENILNAPEHMPGTGSSRKHLNRWANATDEGIENYLKDIRKNYTPASADAIEEEIREYRQKAIDIVEESKKKFNAATQSSINSNLYTKTTTLENAKLSELPISRERATEIVQNTVNKVYQDLGLTDNLLVNTISGNEKNGKVIHRGVHSTDEIGVYLDGVYEAASIESRTRQIKELKEKYKDMDEADFYEMIHDHPELINPLSAEEYERKLIETASHETRHHWQQEQNPEMFFDGSRKIDKSSETYDEYYEQSIEKDARQYADDFVNKHADEVRNNKPNYKSKVEPIEQTTKKTINTQKKIDTNNTKIKNETIEKLNKTKQMYEDILTNWTSASGDFNRQINNMTVGPHKIYAEGKQYLDKIEDLKNNYNVDDYVDGSYTIDEEVFKYSEGTGLNGENVLKVEGDLIDAPNAYASNLNKTLSEAEKNMTPEELAKFKNGFEPEKAIIKTETGGPKLNRKKIVRNKAGLLDDLGKPGAIMSGLNILGAVGDFKDARRKGHGVVSSVARAGVQFAVGEALGLWAIPVMAAKEVPGLIVKGADMLYKENRRMNSAANFQTFGDAQFQDTQQLATMRQSGMEMAKMAQYNLQQTLMGNEATYLHR